MPSALFSVGGSSAQVAQVVTFGATTPLAIVNTAGIDYAEWTVVGQSHAATAVTVTPGAKGLTATIAFPADPGTDRSVLLECKANGGKGANGSPDARLICRRVIGTSGHSGIVPVSMNESFERDAIVGWAQYENGARPGSVQVNGTPVTGVNTPPSISSRVTGGVSSLAAIPHVYGNYAVARRLIDSLTPEKKVTLIQLGDSRAAQQATERVLETYAWGVPWGGFALNPNTLAAGGAPWTNTVYTPTTAPVASPIDAYVGRIAPNGLIDTAFSAGANPGGSNNRFVYGATIDLTTCVVAYPQFAGRVPTVRSFFRKGPTGYTVNDLHQVIYSVYGTNLGDVTFSTYAASEATARIDTPAPAWNWATMPILSYNIQVAGATTRANEHVYSLFSPLVESDIGVTHYNCSVGGRTIDHCLNTDIFSPALWSEFVPLLSGEKVLWLSLGTNGVGSVGGDVASFLARAKQMIALFRAQAPNGLVLVDSAYAGSNDRGLSPGRRKALIQLCIDDPLVMFIDTYAALGGYEMMRVANYFGAAGASDGTHFDATTGRPMYAATIGDLIGRAAAA